MPEFTIGNYLATRLEQIGIKHYFMVPGDYNLVLLDQPGGPRTVDHQPAGARLLTLHLSWSGHTDQLKLHYVA